MNNSNHKLISNKNPPNVSPSARRSIYINNTARGEWWQAVVSRTSGCAISQLDLRSEIEKNAPQKLGKKHFYTHFFHNHWYESL